MRFLKTMTLIRGENEEILESIEKLSEGRLTIDIEKVKEDNLFEKLYKSKRKPRPRYFIYLI